MIVKHKIAGLGVFKTVFLIPDSERWTLLTCEVEKKFRSET